MAMGVALAQAAPPATALDMVLGGGLSTKIVLLVLALLSFASWAIIFWKTRQFSAIRSQGERFFETVSQARSLDEVYKSLVGLPDSPFGRVFRRGMNFFGELRPAALHGTNPGEGLSLTQLEALRSVMEKEEVEERDDLSRGLPWLAIIGSISPLLGLMGTVIGIMRAFLGIAATGSANIGAVAPGVAEALVTTVAGLAVAIPAVIAYNHFAAKLDTFVGDMEGFSSEFIATLAREGKI